MDRRIFGSVIAILTVCGCGPLSGATAKPSLDLLRVVSQFNGKCISSSGPPDLLCQAVDFSAMTADGQILTVPTVLSAEERVYATRICDEFVKNRRDPLNLTLGYREIQVLGVSGEQLSVCMVRIP